VSAFLSAGDNAEKLLAAFKEADESFRNEGDDTLKQMIASKPLSGLVSLEKLANNLHQTLDSENLFIALRQRFEEDWSNQSTEIHMRAAQLYRACLERALAVRCNQILPAIFVKVERVETNTEKLLDGHREILSGHKEILDAIKSIQFSKPSTFSLLFTIREPPKDFIGRTGEIDDLLTNFKHGVSVFGLTGSGGIGKTALARLLASRLADQFEDARLEIDLQGVPYRTQTPLTTANAMRRLLQPFYPEKTLPDDEASLHDLFVGTFSQKRVLLLLDNAHNAAQVRPLLPPSPSAALVTSRMDLSGLNANGIYAKKLDTLLLGDARPECVNDLRQLV
jgi:hypothetical protein